MSNKVRHLQKDAFVKKYFVWSCGVYINQENGRFENFYLLDVRFWTFFLLSLRRFYSVVIR